MNFCIDAADSVECAWLSDPPCPKVFLFELSPRLLCWFAGDLNVSMLDREVGKPMPADAMFRNSTH